MQSRTWDCAISRRTDDRQDSTRQDEAAVHHLHGDRPPPVLHPEHTAGCPPPQRPTLSMKGQERAISRKKRDASPPPSPSASPAAIQCTVANGLCRNIGDFLQDCPSAGGSGRSSERQKKTTTPNAYRHAKASLLGMMELIPASRTEVVACLCMFRFPAGGACWCRLRSRTRRRAEQKPSAQATVHQGAMRDAQRGEQHVHPSLSLSFCSTDSFRPSRDSKLKKKGPGGSVAPAELLCCAKPWNSNPASFFSGPALSDSVMSGRNYTALRNTAPVKFSSCYYTFLSLDGILNEELHQSVRCLAAGGIFIFFIYYSVFLAG